MEAVKDRFTGVGRNARAFVVDPDPDLIADSRRRDLDQTAGRREADGIVEDVIDRARQTVRLAHHGRGVLARARKGDACATGLTPGLPACDQLLDHWTKIDAIEGGADEVR